MSLATFRRKIDVFGTLVNGAGEAKPANCGGRLKSGGWRMQEVTGRRIFPLRGRY
jgi:4-hydroxy-3-methylbut-2-en-1-yl diphosphate synthase IspG/GcpE